MRLQVVSVVALAACGMLSGATVAIAQDTNGGAPETTPPATGETPPQGGTTDQTTAPATGTQLPEVQVIQEQPKPKPVPVKQAAKPKAKPVAPQPVSPAEVAPEVSEGASEVRMSPVGGSEIPLAKVPGSVGRATAADEMRAGTPTPENILQARVPGVIVTDLQGNEFQTDVQYRGFSSSPVNGVPQGLAVYQNGVRINEAFGDIVNWDFLPSNAINDITVVATNPVFGLNAIGGAISIGMRDGFNFEGVETDFRMGSFGRIQGSLAAGARSGSYAAFLAVEDIHDDGWRDFSPADIRRIYADLGFKNREAEFHVNFTGADNFVGAVTAAPVELLDLDYSRTYTSPQTTDNDLAMVSVNGSVKATETTTVSGVAYYRHFKQKHVDANILEVDECGPGGSQLCLEGDPTAVLESGGVPIDSGVLDGSEAASIDRTSQDADSFGGSIQAVDKSKLFGLGNQFLIGTSYDHGRVIYTASSELGTVGPKFVVSPTDPPSPLSGPDELAPRNLKTTNDYIGVYFSDTLDVTDRLALTVGGRYNFARIEIEDLTGVDEFLNGTNTYQRFNPMAGLTYEIRPGLSFYGGYSEANRAPTPAELACSDEENPCLIESFLTSDPPLKQVVSRTAEAGLRGEMATPDRKEKLDWSVGYFRTLLTDDIITVASPTSGRGFFQNAGDTLREGVEASVSYTAARYFLYANYSYVDATFRDPILLPSPNNPSEDVIPCGDTQCIQVLPGDHLPGIPAHKFKAGFDYWITPKWKFGADLIAASSQFFFGDEANLNKPLGGYAKVNLHTSYDVTDHVQIYGLIDNLFDARYGTFGNYFNLDAANAAVVPPDSITFTDARTIVPAQPFAAYGGIKVKF